MKSSASSSGVPFRSIAAHAATAVPSVEPATARSARNGGNASTGPVWSGIATDADHVFVAPSQVAAFTPNSGQPQSGLSAQIATASPSPSAATFGLWPSWSVAERSVGVGCHSRSAAAVAASAAVARTVAVSTTTPRLIDVVALLRIPLPLLRWRAT